jgi:CheY-like chemotaxis protein
VGSGSIFSFDIVVDLADPGEIDSSIYNQRVIALKPNQPDYRILVVEDIEDNRRLLFELLSNVGFDVKTAENGREAITLWQQWQPDLILMDMLMPVLSGSEATQQIKATAQGQKTVIIAITANAFADDKAEALKVGCDDFITKPFREEIIFEKIAHHLGVCYDYDAETPSQEADKNVLVNQLKPYDLKVMPRAWIEQLHEAAVALDELIIVELIEEIPQIHQTLAENLTKLVEDFHWNIIFELTNNAKNSLT